MPYMRKRWKMKMIIPLLLYLAIFFFALAVTPLPLFFHFILFFFLAGFVSMLQSSDEGIVWWSIYFTMFIGIFAEFIQMLVGAGSNLLLGFIFDMFGALVFCIMGLILIHFAVETNKQMRPDRWEDGSRNTNKRQR
jgi:hypothetical protein